MTEVKAMDPEMTNVDVSAISVTDSNEILKPDKEGTKDDVTTEPTNGGSSVSSQDAEQTAIASEASTVQQESSSATPQDKTAEQCDVKGETSSTVDSANELDDGGNSSKASESEIAKCLPEVTSAETGTTSEEIRDEVVLQEATQAEISTDHQTSVQQSSALSETATVQQQTSIASEMSTIQQQTSIASETSSVQQQTSTTTEEFSKSSSEMISTQTTVKQTIVSSEESSVIRSMESSLKVNSEENLLDPDKVSELRRSPYYDSLIANRISMESKFSETLQNGEQQVVNHQNDVLTQEVQSLSEVGTMKEQVTGSSSTLENDSVSREVSSLKEVCEEAMRASPQSNDTVRPSSAMLFKVTKFEPKPFSEVKSSSEWTYNESSFFKSEESSMSLNGTLDDVSSSNEVQSTDDMGVPPVNEDVPFRFSPNAYKPPPEEEMDFMDLPKKKKMFSSSSFYEEPNAIYPTVEEQVELCRKIADSLCDDSNKKSKGANMFFKRVKKAEKWAVESIGTGYDGDYYEPPRAESVATPDPATVPYVRVSKGPPQLKLILDPRHLLDMKRLRQEGVNIVEHNAISPEVCLDLVKDLNSPTGRGALLFAKRKKKSEEWVVDEEKVKQLLREREYDYGSSPEPPTSNLPSVPGIEPLIYPRVQMIKTPWAAAMESPIGSCLGAFKDVHPNEVAQSVIRAAETKIMTYPTPVRAVIEPVIKPESNVQKQNYAPPPSFAPMAPAFAQAPQQQTQRKIASTSSFRAGVYTADPYKPRAPKGWNASSSGGSQFFTMQPQSLPAPVAHEPVQPVAEIPLQQAQTPSTTSSKLTHQPSVFRAHSFTNFNKSPLSWNQAASAYEHVHIKPVKPPSVLVQ